MMPVTHSQLLACMIQGHGGNVSLKADFVNTTPKDIGICMTYKEGQYNLTLVKVEVQEEKPALLVPEKKIIIP